MLAAFLVNTMEEGNQDMNGIQGHRIRSVAPDSIAADLGLQPGDQLLTMDNHPLIDIFDYRLRQLKSNLLISVLQSGRLIEYEIEKDEDDEIGLEFDNPLMQDCTSCDNHCIFCFIDQLPNGLRKSLYVKDDDLRLSFLNGNYATLTNLSDEALERLINYRFSPMNISVHTTNPGLRRKMLCHPKADQIMQQLERIAGAGLQLNLQIVLCPDVNDGSELERTMSDLIGLGSALNSIAVVPVGITRYRSQKRLFPLRSFSRPEAQTVIDQIQNIQDKLLPIWGRRMVYASDEFYNLAGQSYPETTVYDDFPQLENGVGMASLMRQTVADGLASINRDPVEPIHRSQTGQAEGTIKHLLIGTGTAAAPLLESFRDDLTGRAHTEVSILPITNRFFGDQVTVAGLLTGQDIVEQIRPLADSLKTGGSQPVLILPACVIKYDEPVLLDDLTINQVSDAIQIPVWVCASDGGSLVQLLDWVAVKGGHDE